MITGLELPPPVLHLQAVAAGSSGSRGEGSGGAAEGEWLVRTCVAAEGVWLVCTCVQLRGMHPLIRAHQPHTLSRRHGSSGGSGACAV